MAEADNEGNLTKFIEFMFDVIIETLEAFPKVKTGDKMSDKEQKIFKIFLNYLSNHAEISSKDAQRIINKSSATVRRYFAKFIELGLIDI